MNGSIKTKGWSMVWGIMGLLMMATVVLPFAAYAADNQATLTVKQRFISSATSSVDDAFIYQVLPIEQGSPLPLKGGQESTGGYLFTITGNSSFDVGSFGFKYPGIYRYQFSQVIPSTSQKYIYDERVYTVEARVGSALGVTFVVSHADGTKADSIEFVNRYIPDPSEDLGWSGAPSGSGAASSKPTPGPKTGNYLDIGLHVTLLAFGGLLIAGAVVYLVWDRRQERQGRQGRQDIHGKT